MRYVPLLLSGTFAFLQLTYAARRRFKSGGKHDGAVESEAVDISAEESRGLFARWQQHVHLHGGYVIYAYMLARLVGSIALLYVFSSTTFGDCENTFGNNGWGSSSLCAQTSLTIALVSHFQSFFQHFVDFLYSATRLYWLHLLSYRHLYYWPQLGSMSLFYFRSLQYTSTAISGRWQNMIQCPRIKQKEMLSG